MTAKPAATPTRPLRGNKSCRRLPVPDFLSDKMISGSFEYFPGDQQRWHTNSEGPGARCYIAWSENGSSGMRFIIDGEVVTSQDVPGWQYRIFNVPQPHCVFADCYRKSFGWWIPHQEIEKIQPVRIARAEDVLSVA